jgi:uncharacterized protein YgiM (DUF1202 family)
MQNPQTERRIIDGALWFLAGCVILAILTSCSGYANTPAPLGSATPSATVSKSIVDYEPTPSPITCTVTGYLNFRTSPSRSAAVIRVLEVGERVTVIETGNWLKVTTRNKMGYIYSKFCI